MHQESITNLSGPVEERGCLATCAIGITTALCLHNAIYSAGSVAAAIWESQHGAPTAYGDSPIWALLWITALATVVSWARPRLLDWAAPFTLFVGYWFLGALATNWHPDTPKEANFAAFAAAMFMTCFGLWGLAMLLLVVRWVLTALGIQK